MITFGSRNPYVAITSLACIVFFIIYTWYHLQHSNLLSEDDILNKETIWEIRKPDQFSYQITSGCVLTSSFEVFNYGGKYETNRLLGRQYFTESQTMSGLFKVLKKAQVEAATLNAEFDSYYGFPITLQIDWDANIADDECFYEISNFKKISTLVL